MSNGIGTSIGSPIGSKPFVFDAGGIGIGIGGASGAAWYLSGKADNTDPSFWADFENNRYAVNGAEEAFSDIFTFTRSTTGTYFDANGVMQIAAINTPRFDHDPLTGEKLGLLIEEQRTNIIPSSEVFSGTGWNVDGAILNVGGTTPSGGNNATSISQGPGNNRIYYFDNSGVTGSKTLSIFVKSNAGNTFSISATGGMSPAGVATVNTLTGVVTGAFPSATSLSIGNGWFRFIIPVSVSAAGGNSTYWSISGPLNSVYIWGAQLEAGAFATSYIPTTTAAVTRAADTINSSATNTIPFADWYNISTGGTIFTATDTLSVGSLFIGNTPSGEKWDTRNNSSTNVRSIVDHSSSNTGYSSLTVANAYGAHKVASTNFVSSFILCFDGVLSALDNTGAIAEISSINLMSGTTGHVKEFRYYPIRVSNSSLQELTS